MPPIGITHASNIVLIPRFDDGIAPRLVPQSEPRPGGPLVQRLLE